MDTAALPTLPAPFIGRQDELAQIGRLLAKPDCRLLTLLGPGGIGKTRLALEAARLQPERFADGVFFAALQPLTAVDQVMPAIADAIGLQFSSGVAMAQQLRDFMRERQLLLILDNFEHLLDAAEVVSDLLAHAPGLKIVVTSRERLHLVEEWILDVEGLAVPSNAENGIADFEAVQLFVQRAQQVQLDFTLTDERKAAVARICSLVGGMPLGIELAAVWVRALSCEAIASEIERGIDILASPARNMPPRHRNMRAALEHSWKLLPPVEQTVYRRLSIFRGGFTRDAAEVVAGASVWTLTALRDKSLIRADTNGRYHLQELLRQYAEEQLEASGESQAIRDAHSAFYADFLEQRWELLISCHQPRAVREIDAEIDNIRVAWQTMCRGQKIAELYRSARSLWLAADLRCRFHEMVALFGQGVAALRPDAGTPEVDRTLGVLMALYGWFHVGAGLPEPGKALVQGALALLQPVGSAPDMFLGLYSQQLILMYYDDREAAWQATLDAVNFARQHHQTWELARVLNHQATMLLDHGYHVVAHLDLAAAHALARQMTDECLSLLGDCGDLWVKAAVTGILLGSLNREQGNLVEARRQYQSSLALYEEVGQSWGIGAIHRMLGYVEWLMHEYEAAQQHYLISLRVFHENGQMHEQIWALNSITELFIMQVDPGQAVLLLALTNRYSATFISSSESRYCDRLLAQLEAQLTPEKYRAAIERSQAVTLEATVKAMLVDQNLARWLPVEARLSSLDALTDREQEILKLMADGLTNRTIAEKLFLSIGTVKWYSSQILSKLHVENRIQALARAQELHLLA